MKNDLSAIRNDYGNRALNESELPKDPTLLLQDWMDEAINEGLYEPNAVVLSTTDSDGFPSSRVVLLKAIQDGKLVFFSNYSSAKGKELEKNPKAGLLFFWPQLHRQIRIKGNVERISDAHSDLYFKERPYESKLGAWASAQSEVISGREAIESKYSFYKGKFKDKEIPRPAFWGGFQLHPKNIEFWQGRSGRLHDRLVYGRDGAGWGIWRLAP
ncbi:MAG: pyridoxamine 5'-phosphate oxidase [Bacteroidales bacterium]|nr:pyridoxamine 5'-phosphate oxidase [Bacteroidales bacterium]MCF8389951.1 pyridoxamine 5'-phosphate oxidase [Bacteroidales bacterium]